MSIANAIANAIAGNVAGTIDGLPPPFGGGGGGGGGTPTFDLEINGLTGVGTITRTDGPGDNTGVSLNSDGTKLFIMGTNGTHEINQYNLSSPWDITSAGATPDLAVTYGVPSGETTVRAATMSFDGNYITVCGVTNDRVAMYQLTAGPWDLSGGLTTIFSALDLSTDRPYTVQWNYDGTAFYIIDGINDNLIKYTCSTPYTVATRALAGRANYPIANISFGEGGFITADERFIVYSDGATPKLVEMTTPGDVTTQTFVHNATAGFPAAGSPRGIFVKPDGSRIYCGNQGNTTDQADTNI